MPEKLEKLMKHVRSASGSDSHLDAEIARSLDGSYGNPVSPLPYTSSVDSCINLIERVLPGWHWHVGYGPKGVMPYAALKHGKVRYEATAATVPLALLTALLDARSQKKGG